MPKKKPGMTQEQQSESFRAKVRELIAAGELSATEADAAFERAVNALRRAGSTFLVNTKERR